MVSVWRGTCWGTWVLEGHGVGAGGPQGGDRPAGPRWGRGGQVGCWVGSTEAAPTPSKDGGGVVAQGKHDALGNNRHYPQTYHFLQLKDRAGGPVLQRCSLRSRNVAAGSPTWIWLEFPQSRHPIPPPSPSPPPPHLHQENLSVHKSYHDFRANSHISLPPPVTLLPGRGFLGPGCPGCSGCWLRGPLPLLAVASLLLPWL